MGIAESRIETTDRLRRQGKWEEASRFKDQAKQRHRDAGKSRQESNRLAWEAVQEKFPPVPPEAEELLDRVMAVRHPPRGQDGEDDEELQFQGVWFAHHMVRVLTQYFHIPDANKRWASCLITECLVENAGPDSRGGGKANCSTRKMLSIFGWPFVMNLPRTMKRFLRCWIGRRTTSRDKSAGSGPPPVRLNRRDEGESCGIDKSGRRGERKTTD